jgi:hypothetical protein
MYEKVKQAITNSLKKIEDGSFDEDTIRTLLITSREFISKEGLIKEISHFIAHPKRSKGIFHKKINTSYAKFTLVASQLENSGLENVKTEEQLSDFMLSGVSVEKTEAKLFEILYYDGLDDFPEEHLKKYTGFTKNEAREFINKYYVKHDGYYYITTNRTEKIIRALKQIPKSKYNTEFETYIAENIIKAEISIKKIKDTMDRIQKVIRGAIYFNSVFDTQSFKKEITDTISSIINKFKIDSRYKNNIEEQSDNILLCIMTLIHDCKIVFYDKKEAIIYLCFYLDYNYNDLQKPDYDLAIDLYENGVIGLYIASKEIMELPLFVSDLKIKKYVPLEIYNSVQNHSTIMKIDLTTASRINGVLQLTRAET